jgi:hypothetical protein
VVIKSVLQHHFSLYAKEATGEGYTSYGRESCSDFKTDEPEDRRLEGTFCHKVVLLNPGTSAASVVDPRIADAPEAFAPQLDAAVKSWESFDLIMSQHYPHDTFVGNLPIRLMDLQLLHEVKRDLRDPANVRLRLVAPSLSMGIRGRCALG